MHPTTAKMIPVAIIGSYHSWSFIESIQINAKPVSIITIAI